MAIPGLTPPVGQNFSAAVVPLDLTLEGAVSTAVVSPIDGSVAVAVTAQVEIAAASPIDPASVTGDRKH